MATITNTMEVFQTEVDNLNDEIASFLKKPTKACAARVRKLSNAVGKSGLHVRKELIESDKKGY